MKLLVYESKIRSSSKRDHEELDFICNEYLKLDLEIDYVKYEDIIKDVKVKNGSIIQSSIKYEGDYDWVHVRLSSREWRKLKLRETLWGEHQKVKGIPITFGRWNQFMKYKRAHMFKHEVGKISEHVLGMLHELGHYFEGDVAVVHSFFYGYSRLYTKAQERSLSPKRYVRQPSLLKALDWIFNKSYTYKFLYGLKAKVTIEKKIKPYIYFNEKESEGIDHNFMLLLDKARPIAGIPFVINSGYRTPEHNKRVGGVVNSAHTKRLAVDLRARNGKEIYLIVNALTQVGIKRIGINWEKMFVHADIDYTKPTPTIYKY